MSEQSGQRGRQRSDNPLQSERGDTTIQNAVVAQVAGLAAQQVEGVQMGGGTSAAVSGFLGSVSNVVSGPGSAPGGGNDATGVSVELGQQEAAVDLTMIIQYGMSIPQVCEAIRRNVINRVENLVGLRVNEVNISVTDVQIPQERPMLESQQQVKEQASEQERQTGAR